MMKYSRYLFFAALVVSLSISVTSCSSDSNSWYEGSRAHTRERNAFVEDHMEQGMSELEAKQAWEHKQILERAHYRPEEEGLSADELDEMLGH